MAAVLECVYGVGRGRANNLVREITGRFDLKLRSFKLRQLNRFTSAITRQNYLLGSNLKLRKAKNLRRLKTIHCYRGLRLIAYLPSHGQRTHSNAMSARFCGSGTFEYVPTQPCPTVKKLSSYIRRVSGLKLQSDKRYQRLLQRNFKLYQLNNPAQFKQALRRGQLGIFNRLAGIKKTKKKK